MVPFEGRITSTTPKGTDVLDFWHGGAERWRVERDGELQYISDGERTFCRDESGALAPLGGRGIRMAWVTAGLGPFDLVGQSGILQRMSRNVVALSTPVEASLGGRLAWSTQLGEPGATEADRITVTIDDQSGLIIELLSGRGATLNVSRLSTGPIDDEIFHLDYP